MITYLLNTLVDSIKTSLINKLGLDPSTEVDLDDFPQLIDDIPILDSVEELTVTQNGTYTGTDGVTYNPVNVNLPLGSKSVTANGTYNASDDSLQGYSSVTVDIDDTDLYRDTTDNTYESVKTLSNCGAFPMLSLTAEINAVQDLHGYDKPWAGGVGKNKLPLDDFTTTTINGVTVSITEDGGIKLVGTNNGTRSSFTISSVSTNPCYLESGTNTISVASALPSGVSLEWSGTGQNGVSYGSMVSATSKNISVTDDTKPFNYITISVEAGYTVDTTVYLQAENGSTATTWTPYSNICPISGWDAVNVSVSPLNISQIYNGQIYGDGTWVSNSMRLTNVQTAQSNVYFLKAGTYTLDYDKLNSNAPDLLQCSLLTKDDNYTIIDNFANEWNSLPFTFTLTQDGYLYFTVRKDADTNVNPSDYRTKILGQTHTTALSTTCYGGSKDIKGNEIHNRVSVDLGTLDYTYYSGNLFTAIINNLKPVPNTRLCNALCSIYVAKQGNEYASIDGSFVAGFNSASTLAIHDSRFTDTTAFKTAMNGVQLVYELATPTTATSDAIDLTLAEGVNNIWASSGDVGDARYFRKVEL